jgi:hypothetical protein
VLIIVTVITTFSVVKGQTVAVKSNLLYDATATINIGLEVGMSPRWTLDLPVNYNPWEFGENHIGGNRVVLKHWLIQPEARYWFCQKFYGQFIGIHGHIGGFNIGGLKLIGLEDSRFEGSLYGAGLSYGYHWVLSTRWSIEATIGVGYALLDYSEYDGCATCGGKKGDATRNYIGPTKAGVSLIYVIK